MGTKIVMGDPTLEARGLAMDFDVLRQKRIIYDASGVREESLGRPDMVLRLKPKRSNCINCGAPWETVCSYCGTGHDLAPGLACSRI